MDRFHVVNPISNVDEETKKKRIDRFGTVPSSQTPVLSDAIKKRTERFGDLPQAAKANTLNV